MVGSQDIYVNDEESNQLELKNSKEKIKFSFENNTVDYDLQNLKSIDFNSKNMIQKSDFKLFENQ